jgi:hypothetical protein
VRTFDSFDALKSALQTLGPDDLLAGVELTPALAEIILAHDPVNRDLRPGHVARLQREIEGGHWRTSKSPPLRFLASGRMADGQHRCHAVIKAGLAIPVSIGVVEDTINLDGGVGRTLADHLKIHANITDKGERDLASVVTKALCRMPNASNREYLAYFDEHADFILDCVRKPKRWLDEQERLVAAIVKLPLLAVTRAQEILLYKEPVEEVDELLYDVVNAGATAPAGSARREYALQIWEALQTAHIKKAAKIKDLVKWTRGALKYKREGGAVKNAVTARFPGAAQRKKKPRPVVKAA